MAAIWSAEAVERNVLAFVVTQANAFDCWPVWVLQIGKQHLMVSIAGFAALVDYFAQ